MSKILVIAGGGKKHLAPFEKGAVIASFSDLHYQTFEGKTELFVGENILSDFSLIYIRLVGRRYEDLALLVSEAKKLSIPVIDRVFTDSGFVRLPISKLLEAKILVGAGLPVPKTIYGSLKFLQKEASKAFGFPYVLKSTTGKQGHEVWSPRNEAEQEEIFARLSQEKEKRFLAQEFIKAPKRIRALVVGEKVVGAIVRPTRWRKRFSTAAVEKTALNPVPEDVSYLALKATKALMLDIGGVDILVEEGTDKLYVLEVNSAPRWDSIKKTGVDVEKKILNFLESFA